MHLGRVVGCVWSTVKNKGLTGQRLLIVQPVTPELSPTGKRFVATDWSGAGAGELIYWCRGKEALYPFLPAEAPTDCTIVGIVDSIHINRNAKTEGPPAAAEPAAPVPAPAPARSGGRRRKGGEC
jgi:ethanolamine utilization protein EutN